MDRADDCQRITRNTFNLPKGAVPYLRGVSEVYPSLKEMIESGEVMTKQKFASVSSIEEDYHSHRVDAIIRKLFDSGILMKDYYGTDKKTRWKLSPIYIEPLRNFLQSEGAIYG